MLKTQIDGNALLVALVAGGLAFFLLSGPFAWLGSICGLVLVFVLLGYDREGVRTAFESLAFAAVFAFCLTVASAVLWRIVAVNQGNQPTFAGPVADHWLPLFWVGITVVFWPIDRARMSGRVQYPIAASPIGIPRGPEPVPAPYILQPVAPSPAAVFAAPPTQTPPASPHPPTLSSRATFTQPSFSEPEPVAAPVSVNPPSPAAPAAPIWNPPPAAPAAPLPAPPAAPPLPVQSAPEPLASFVPSGKEAMIYVTLVGEGLNVLRAVHAEHLGRDYYKIVEPMPEGETWQYGPGQVVRCKKKNLSSGKAMVAIEEAPRAR